MAEIKTCRFCDLKGKQPCGAMKHSCSTQLCTRPAAHVGSHAYCVVRTDYENLHPHMAWEQTQPEPDRAQFDLMEATLREILDNEDTDAGIAEQCRDALGIEPEEEDTTCHNCHGSGGGPDPETRCNTCKGSGEVMSEAQADAKEREAEDRADQEFERRREDAADREDAVQNERDAISELAAS
jgi:hypothetical protein